MPPSSYSLYTRDSGSKFAIFRTLPSQSSSFRLWLPRHTLSITASESASGVSSTTSDLLPTASSANLPSTSSIFTTSTPYSSPTSSLNVTPSSVSLDTNGLQSTSTALSSERPHPQSLATVVVPSVVVPIVIIGMIVILGAVFWRRRHTKSTQRVQPPPGASFLPEDGFGVASHGTGSKNSVSISASDPKTYVPIAQEDAADVREWQSSPLSPHPFAAYSPTSPPPLDSSHWIPAEQGIGERRPSYAHRRTMRVLRALADADPPTAAVSQSRLD